MELPPLGAVVRLTLARDPAAGAIEPLLRDCLELAVLRKLKLLPSNTDFERLREHARADVERLSVEVDAAREGRSTAQDAVEVDFAVLADSMLIRASSPDGGLLFGFRWRLVRRDRVDDEAFRAEFEAAERRFVRWGRLQAVGEAG